MNRLLKRLLSWLLAVLLVVGLLPVVSAATPEDELTERDYAAAQKVFDQIDDMEAQPSKRGATQTQRTNAAQALVEASENYVEGSLERNGDAFTWMTEEGIRCAYNPRMRRIREEMTAPETEVAEVRAKRNAPDGKQVYVIGPYYGIDDDFTDQYPNEAADIAAALGDGAGYTIYAGAEATIDNVAHAMSNGAVVIFDSHGTTDYENPYDYEDYVTGATMSYLCLTSTEGLTADDFYDGAAWDGRDVYVNGKAIVNHMTQQSPGGILWMALCLGMATDSFCTAFRPQGVEVVYGYSQSVTFAYDYLWEETFWDAMIGGATVAEAVADMKDQVGCWDWCHSSFYDTISEARSEYCAFPIVVSDEDPYPGQRTAYSYGVDDYQTVCSQYTLYTAALDTYQITAVSGNSEWGTVFVDGNMVIPVPAEGYYAASCNVISGTATVAREFYSFIIEPQSDCIVQVEFAPKEPATVELYGISNDTYLSGEYVNLPEMAAPDGYIFCGWTETLLTEDTTEAPELHRFDYLITGSCALYPVYMYQQYQEGSGDYIRVTTAPEDWTGTYAIVYEPAGYIMDGSRLALDSVNNYRQVTLNDDRIAAGEVDGYSFQIAPCSEGYSIQSAAGGYIGFLTENSNGLKTYGSPCPHTLTLDAVGNANIVTEVGAHLRFKTISGQNRFRFYKAATYSSQEPVALYRKDDGKMLNWYSTLGAQAPEEYPPEEPAELIKWEGSSVTLGGALALNFALNSWWLHDTTDNYIVLTRSYADGREDDIVTIPQSEWIGVGGTYIQVSYTNLAAKEMGDKITAVVYNADGKAISETRTDSIAEYSMRMLNRADIVSSDEKRTLFVDMLNYGAAAQVYFDYDTENLVNAWFSVVHASWASPAVETNNYRQSSGCYVGSNLSLEEEIYLQVAFGAAYEEGMCAVLFFIDHYGRQTETQVDIEASGNYCIIRVEGMAIADYRGLVRCTLFGPNGAELGSTTDSMESYVSRMANQLQKNGADLGDAIMKLGASSYAFFH